VDRTQVTSEPEQQAPPAGGEAIAAPPAIAGRSPWQIFARRFRQDRFAVAGFVFVIVMVVLALGAPLIAGLVGHGPNDVSYLREMTYPDGLPKGPNFELKFYFGADSAARDVFVRVIYGARTSLTVAFVATGIALLIGVSVGLAAGFYRGKVDTFLSRTIDVVFSLPILILALGLASACGATKTGCLFGLLKPGLFLVSAIIGLFSWPYIARIVRGQILSLREKEFIESSRAMGAGNLRIMVRELLPNVAAPIIVYTTLIIPNNILFEAALSFLGVGVPDTTPSWGRMLADAADIFTFAWWLMLFPGLFLFATTLAFNMVGDGLRDALDPRTTVTT
jgi:peptide/nickel transport system permease protein